MLSRKKVCRKLLSEKIGINIRERRYKSPKQAIAVAYSQVRKSHPKCKRFFKSRSRKDGNSAVVMSTYIENPDRAYAYSSSNINNKKSIKASYKNKKNNYKFDLFKSFEGKTPKLSIKETNKTVKDTSDDKFYRIIMQKINDESGLLN